MPHSLPVVWSAPFLDRSGYAEEARNFILALDNFGLDVQADPFHWHPWTARLSTGDGERVERLIATAVPERFVQVIHGSPYDLRRHAAAKVAIGRSLFETEGPLPIALMNDMDEIWVASDFNVESFAKAGVERSKLHKIPEPLSLELHAVDLPPLELPHLESRFVFLSVFVWQLRKGWDVLIRAYVEEFAADEDVTLAIKVERDLSVTPTMADVRSQLNRFLNDEVQVGPEDRPPIVLLDLDLTDQDMPRLYRAGDAFVLPSRGEGWGRPLMEAMAMGLPAIGTRATGNLEFMNDGNSYLIDCARVDVPETGWREVPVFRGHRWAEPSTQHLRRLMRSVFEGRREAAAIGAQGRDEIIEQYGRERVARLVAERLEIHGVRPTPTTKAAPPLPSVVWEGDHFVEHSLAVVNRELCRALIGSGRVEVSLRTVSPRNVESMPPAWSSLVARISSSPASGAIRVRHTWPPRFDQPGEGHWVVMQPWEFGGVSREFVDLMNGPVDEIWAPSSYVRDCYVENGVDPGKVVVIPNGVNPLQFNPEAFPLELPTNKGFKFLFVGGTIFRKGIDILLETYLRAFGPDDDVSLVIKDFGTDSFYAGQGMRDQIRSLQANPDNPEIVYIDAEWPHDQLPHLYASCQCLVHPYRAEGFGLPIAEAMACGLPVIVTGHGSCMDFCDPTVAYLIPALEARSTKRRLGDLATVEPPFWAEPDRDELAAAMHRVVADRAEAELVGRRASSRILEGFTWKHSADRVIERLEALGRRKPNARSRRHRGQKASNISHKRLSVCLMVKDEEEFLAGALESVRELADQVVVVDVGSTDRTVQIAEEFGAEVYTFDRADDFGAARNEALRHADGDWVLVLDADERVDPESHAEIRRLMATNSFVGLQVRVLNYTRTEGTSEVLEHRILRLFPNHDDLRFVGRDPHAQLHSRRAGLILPVVDSAVILHHEGYRPQVMKAKQKTERNRLLLEREVAEDPSNPFHAFNLGLTYAVMGRNADAEGELLRAIALSPTQVQGGTRPNYIVNAYSSLALAIYAQGRHAEAVVYCERAIELAPGFPDAFVTMGAALARLGRYEEALRAYRSAMGSNAESLAAASDRSASGWKALLGMGEVYLFQNRWGEALQPLREAYVLAPHDPRVGTALARAVLGLGDTGEGEDLLEEAASIDGAPPETWLALGDLYSTTGRHEQAARTLEEGLARYPDHQTLIHKLSEQAPS